MAWHGIAWHFMAWHGMVWHGMSLSEDRARSERSSARDLDPFQQGGSPSQNVRLPIAVFQMEPPFYSRIPFVPLLGRTVLRLKTCVCRWLLLRWSPPVYSRIPHVPLLGRIGFRRSCSSSDASSLT